MHSFSVTREEENPAFPVRHDPQAKGGRVGPKR